MGKPGASVERGVTGRRAGRFCGGEAHDESDDCKSKDQHAQRHMDEQDADLLGSILGIGASRKKPAKSIAMIKTASSQCSATSSG
jgi:hypothetical protein